MTAPKKRVLVRWVFAYMGSGGEWITYNLRTRKGANEAIRQVRTYGATSEAVRVEIPLPPERTK